MWFTCRYRERQTDRYTERKTERFFPLRTISQHLSDSQSQHASACHRHDRCSKIEYRFQWARQACLMNLNLLLSIFHSHHYGELRGSRESTLVHLPNCQLAGVERWSLLHKSPYLSHTNSYPASFYHQNVHPWKTSHNCSDLKRREAHMMTLSQQ